MSRYATDLARAALEDLAAVDRRAAAELAAAMLLELATNPEKTNAPTAAKPEDAPEVERHERSTRK